MNDDLVYKSDSYSENGTAVNVKTYYVGKYEKVVRTGGAQGGLTEHRYYVGNNVFIQRSNSTTEKNALHKDHQGSVVAITDASGNVVTQSLYGPFGEQIQIINASDLADYTYMMPTDRRYTGHKMMNEFGIIHMGGRIYDPILGRFLQADPFVQAPDNSQSYNRYSYVLNNPLSYTDPSGYFFSKLWTEIKPFVGAIAGIVVAVYCPACTASFWAAAGTGAAIGAGSAAINGGNILKGALIGAFSGAAFQQIEAHFTGALEGGLGHVLAHGITGGVTSVLHGGKC